MGWKPRKLMGARDAGEKEEMDRKIISTMRTWNNVGIAVRFPKILHQDYMRIRADSVTIQ